MLFLPRASDVGWAHRLPLLKLRLRTRVGPWIVSEAMKEHGEIVACVLPGHR